jgi:hypothetical protein
MSKYNEKIITMKNKNQDNFLQAKMGKICWKCEWRIIRDFSSYKIESPIK